MKILLDTNVLIAAFVARGVCHELFEHCARQHALVTSDFIINEFREKLTLKFKRQAEDVGRAVELLLARMTVVAPAPLESPVCRDADDDQVLAAAVAGGCDCIVTGDKDLLVIGRYAEIDIVSPADFRQYEEKL
jgi:uncharacterized protein